MHACATNHSCSVILKLYFHLCFKNINTANLFQLSSHNQHWIRSWKVITEILCLPTKSYTFYCKFNEINYQTSTLVHGSSVFKNILSGSKYWSACWGGCKWTIKWSSQPVCTSNLICRFFKLDSFFRVVMWFWQFQLSSPCPNLLPPNTCCTLGIRQWSPSCGSGHVSAALLPIYHAPLLWQVRHARGSGSTSGNELVLVRSENDTFL